MVKGNGDLSVSLLQMIWKIKLIFSSFLSAQISELGHPWRSWGRSTVRPFPGQTRWSRPGRVRRPGHRCPVQRPEQRGCCLHLQRWPQRHRRAAQPGHSSTEYGPKASRLWLLPFRSCWLGREWLPRLDCRISRLWTDSLFQVRTPQTSQSIYVLKMGQHRPLFVFFGLYNTKQFKQQQIKVKICHVHPVYGTGIRTHEPSNMSRLP